MIKYFKEGAVQPKKLVAAKDYMSMTLPKLKALAKDLGIEVPAKATKAKIVKALSESDK